MIRRLRRWLRTNHLTVVVPAIVGVVVIVLAVVVISALTEATTYRG